MKAKILTTHQPAAKARGRHEAFEGSPSLADQTQHAEACIGFFIEQLQASKHDKKTISSYAADVRIFQGFLGKDLLEVQRADIYRTVDAWQQQGLAESTIRRRAAALRQFFDLLFNAGLISIRPTANLRLPKVWKRVPRTAPPEDLERVIAAVGTVSPFDVRDRVLLLLLRDTGPRATAVCRSELSDIDWKQSRLLLRHDKFGKEHWIPLSARSLNALRQYIETARPYFVRDRDLTYLFPYRWTNRPGPLTRQRLWQIVNHRTEVVLGKRYSPH